MLTYCKITLSNELGADENYDGMSHQSKYSSRKHMADKRNISGRSILKRIGKADKHYDHDSTIPSLHRSSIGGGSFAHLSSQNLKTILMENDPPSQLQGSLTTISNLLCIGVGTGEGARGGWGLSPPPHFFANLFIPKTLFACPNF